jgi:hypothetical protein
MTTTPSHDPAAPDPAAPCRQLPRLDDHAVIQVHDFLFHLLDLFEARYGDQIHRYYQGLHEDLFCSDPGPSAHHQGTTSDLWPDDLDPF